MIKSWLIRLGHVKVQFILFHMLWYCHTLMNLKGFILKWMMSQIYVVSTEKLCVMYVHFSIFADERNKIPRHKAEMSDICFHIHTLSNLERDTIESIISPNGQDNWIKNQNGNINVEWVSMNVHSLYWCIDRSISRGRIHSYIAGLKWF